MNRIERSSSMPCQVLQLLRTFFMFLDISCLIQLHKDNTFNQFVVKEKKKEMIDTANTPEHLFFPQFTLGSGEYC